MEGLSDSSSELSVVSSDSSIGSVPRLDPYTPIGSPPALVLPGTLDTLEKIADHSDSSTQSTPGTRETVAIGSPQGVDVVSLRESANTVVEPTPPSVPNPLTARNSITRNETAAPEQIVVDEDANIIQLRRTIERLSRYENSESGKVRRATAALEGELTRLRTSQASSRQD